MKKCIALITSVAILLLATIPSFAAAPDTSMYEFMSIEALAYCDLDEAPIEYQDDILAARDAIIHSTNWTVNGQTQIVLEDGTIQELPEFSELFPDWDIPKAKNIPDIVTYSANFNGVIYLFNPTTTQTPPFYVFYPGSYLVEMGATSIPGSSWNAAFTNYTSGYEVGNATNLPVGAAYQLNVASTSFVYGARASTFSTEGYAALYVSDVI